MEITLINTWLVLGPSLVLAILSGYLSERVGIVNIAINGMMTFGSLFFMIFSNVFFKLIPNNNAYEWTFLLSFLISSLLSTVVGILFALATVKLKADHVIAGTGINLLSTGIGLIIADRSSTLFGTSVLSNRYVPKTIIFSGENGGIRLESLICFLIAMLIIVLVYLIMNFTRLGLRYRACGENPNAVDAQGVNVIKYQWIGLMVVGAIAGLSGSLFAFAYTNAKFTGDVNGLGFIAIALLIVSSWKIIPGTIIGLAFALLLAYTQQTLGNVSIGYMLRMIPFIVTLVVMLLFGKFIKGPKSAGLHFDKGLR
ncbi:ABC transporter permease [Mycoplasmoides alvi]|uniref:ABC transporter permease n=1 Tax=Mycoplasmoides alvi TaxID=78580 RepID=UPI00051AC354|nr:ABC transporter permease [Mycoplasmoides alvi]